MLSLKDVADFVDGLYTPFFIGLLTFAAVSSFLSFRRIFEVIYDQLNVFLFPKRRRVRFRASAPSESKPLSDELKQAIVAFSLLLAWPPIFHALGNFSGVKYAINMFAAFIEFGNAQAMGDIYCATSALTQPGQIVAFIEDYPVKGQTAIQQIDDASDVLQAPFRIIGFAMSTLAILLLSALAAFLCRLPLLKGQGFRQFSVLPFIVSLAFIGGVLAWASDALPGALRFYVHQKVEGVWNDYARNDKFVGLDDACVSDFIAQFPRDYPLSPVRFGPAPPNPIGVIPTTRAGEGGG